jgi:hypothetical protein
MLSPLSSGHLVYSYLLTLVHRLWISYTLKMEAIRSSETSVNKISTRHHIPEDGILQSHSRENLKSYKLRADRIRVMLATIQFRTSCILVCCKNVKIGIYKIIFSPILYGCETWPLTLREHRLRVFENRALRRIVNRKGIKYTRIEKTLLWGAS